MLYVYEDWTLEEIPRCFYVGQGTQSRVQKIKRNRFHTHVVKRFGISRTVVFESQISSEIDKVEIFLISFRNTFHHSTKADRQVASNFCLGGKVNRGHTYKLNDEQRAARKVQAKEIANRPEMKQKRRESALKSWQDPIVRAKRLENLKSPKTIEARIAALGTVEVRKKISDGVNKPKAKAAIIASNVRRGKVKKSQSNE